MKESVKDQMRTELLQSHGGMGLFAGFACFVVLSILLSFIPGIPELIKGHDWPGITLMVISALVGWTVGASWKDSRRQAIWAYDDDELRNAYDKLRDKRLRSYVFWCVAIGLVVAYLLFK